VQPAHGDAGVDQSAERRRGKAPIDPVRIGATQVPVAPALEPPRLASVRLQNLARMRQPLNAELRADERLVVAPFCVAVRREGPRHAVREGARCRGESVVLVRKTVVPVEVLDVGLEVIIARKAGRVVDQQALEDERLRSIECLDQPTPVVWLSARSIPHPSLKSVQVESEG
jgi:hypothetical protein